MTLSDVLAALHENTDPHAREQLLVEAVQLGLYDPPEFVTLESALPTHDATFIVMREPLKIGGVRVAVSARTQQRIADVLGCTLPTPKLLQLWQEQATIQLQPYTRTTVGMASQNATLEASGEIDRRTAEAIANGAPAAGLVSLAAKSWVVTRSGHDWQVKAPNMGLALPAHPNAPIHWLQNPQRDPANAHDLYHHDYSQLCYLVLAICTVDGKSWSTTDVVKDPELWRLLADDGPLHDLRLAVPVESCSAPALPAPVVVDWAAVETTRILPANYRPDLERTPGLAVIHSAETAETRQVAENVGHWLARGPFPNGVVSVHWIVDDDSIIAGAPEKNVAFGAKGANHDGIHIEIAGRANQGAAGWNDPYSQAALLRAAAVTARACRTWNIPVRWLSAADLRDPSQRGITSHASVSLGRKASTHTDPGPAFPVARFLRMVEADMQAFTPDPDQP